MDVYFGPKSIAVGATVAAGFCCAYKLNRLLKEKGESKKKETREPLRLVLFFPDAKIACKDFFDSVAGCHNQHCTLSHEETGLRQLLAVLKSAKKSISICVFVIACHELVDVVLQRHRRGIRVRVITDAEMDETSGSQTFRFLRDGIKVRTKKMPYHMHHKFAVVDEEVVMMGSFNWTNQAVTGNFESVIVTNDSWAVKPFCSKFEELWDLMEPGKKEEISKIE